MGTRIALPRWSCQPIIAGGSRRLPKPPHALLFRNAAPADAPALAALHTSVANDLTARHGRGPWSTRTGDAGALRAIATRHVCVAESPAGALVGTFQLVAKKPWAIDPAYFTPGSRPIYLVAMAVVPSLQRLGIGRQLLAEAVRRAASLGDALRLDAFEGAAGARDFYAKCGWTDRGRKAYRGARLRYFEWVERR